MDDRQAKSPLSSYLSSMSEMVRATRPQTLAYSCCEDYVAKHGVEFASKPLTQDERAYVLSAIDLWGKQMPIKQCFYNSQMVLIFGDHEHRLSYVEGYMLKIIPILHGWLEINGKVIDVTARHPRRGKGRLSDRVFGEWKDDRLYMGVKFKRDYVRHTILKRGYAGSLIDDWQNSWPLLRDKAED